MIINFVFIPQFASANIPPRAFLLMKCRSLRDRICKLSGLPFIGLISLANALQCEVLAVPVGQCTYAQMQRFEAHAVVVRVEFSIFLKPSDIVSGHQRQAALPTRSRSGNSLDRAIAHEARLVATLARLA